jgi:glycosyltransferase involved in cell wall biosynthesis
MKVLLAVESHFKEYGGPYTAITQEVEYLNKKKIYNKILFKNSNYFSYSVDLENIIQDFDIVHIYGIWRPFLIKVFYIAKKLKKKIIISPIGALEPWSLNQKKLKKKIAWYFYQKKILDNADIIHATSDIEAKNIEDNKVKSKIKVIAHGLTIDNKFNPVIKKNKKKIILFFSRVHSKKGLIELISIWKNLKSNNDWQLHIYGPISDKFYFNKMINEIKYNKLEKSIFYLESVFNHEKKMDIYKKADGFILPSKSENFGISIGEAMSCALPVLTTLQTPWKIIQQYNAGYIFNFSKKEIQLNLNKFMTLSDEDRYKMGVNALNLIKEKFESKKIFNLYEDLYKSLI